MVIEKVCNNSTVRRSTGMMTQILLLALLFSAGTLVTQSPKSEAPQSQASEFKLIIRKTIWEPIFFQAIDERAQQSDLPTLRVALPKDDLELRLWNGFGLTALEGVVLRRRAGEWSAIHLDGIHAKLPKASYQKTLSAPKSGWTECWRKLTELGILTLPDAGEIKCSTMMEDGMSYVVEINQDFTYRTYMYDNPSYAKCDQAQRMISIGNLIAEEFDVPEMRTRK